MHTFDEAQEFQDSLGRLGLTEQPNYGERRGRGLEIFEGFREHRAQGTRKGALDCHYSGCLFPQPPHVNSRDNRRNRDGEKHYLVDIHQGPS